MSIKQISVFLENRPGALEEFTALLGEGNIDLMALSLADTTDFGIARAIVDKTEKALELAKSRGFTANITEVLAVEVPDSPGGLAGALRVLREGDISIEYLYSFVRRVHHNAIIIFRVDKPAEAENILKQNGVSMLRQEEINCAIEN
ncbi:amino acid-binding protein [Clostridia bacterium OttesenSCG-928-O13]|nr:amino acid-binding protein [Clostridia bacterium OttesenSCG-928-O13]